MLKFIVIMIFWLFLVLGMQRDQLWTWMFILPLFLLVYTWSEQLEEH
jgi:hypothetical protein